MTTHTGTARPTRQMEEEMAMTVTAAEYTAGKQPMVAITQIVNGRRTRISAHPVSGKREARQVAAKFNATPWNF